MRALIQQLHPRAIDEEGLIPGLRRLVSERQANNGLNINLKISGDRRLPAISKMNCLILQRKVSVILSNMPKRIKLKSPFLEDGNRVSMCIEDAGIGFDSTQLRSLPGHLGLTSMSERVQALGGTLEIESKPGKGTRVRVELVLSAGGAANA
jgi:signal transduction histidine kinase